MIEKPRRYENKAYREFIKKQPCCITGRMEVDPHHTKSVGSGGSDLTLIPLIHELHQECHTIGAGTFQKKYSIDFDLIQLALIKKWVKGGM
jgi:hypothetical protein